MGVGNESVGEEDTRHIQEGHRDGELRPWEGGELGRPGSRKSREEATERRRGRRSGGTAGAARSRGPEEPGAGQWVRGGALGGWATWGRGQGGQRARGGVPRGRGLGGLGAGPKSGQEPGAELSGARRPRGGAEESGEGPGTRCQVEDRKEAGRLGAGPKGGMGREARASGN